MLERESSPVLGQALEFPVLQAQSPLPVSVLAPPSFGPYVFLLNLIQTLFVRTRSCLSNHGSFRLSDAEQPFAARLTEANWLLPVNGYSEVRVDGKSGTVQTAISSTVKFP